MNCDRYNWLPYLVVLFYYVVNVCDVQNELGKGDCEQVHWLGC